MPICCTEVISLGLRGTGDLDGDGGVAEGSIWDGEKSYLDFAELDTEDIAKRTPRTTMLVAFVLLLLAASHFSQRDPCPLAESNCITRLITRFNRRALPLLDVANIKFGDKRKDLLPIIGDQGPILCRFLCEK